VSSIAQPKFHAIALSLTLTLTALSFVASQCPAVCDSSKDKSSAQSSSNNADVADDIRKKLSKLVLEFYPKAKVTTDEGVLHFEYRLKREDGFYSSQRQLFAPESGGILGDVYVEKGEYDGDDKAHLNVEVVNGFHSSLVMAPYSKRQDAHLMAKLVFPSDAPEEFKEKFKTIVNKYNQGEPKDEAKKTESGGPSPPTPYDQRPEFRRHSFHSEHQAPAEKPPEDTQAKPKPPE
jgi:hypothetical protein